MLVYDFIFLSLLSGLKIYQLVETTAHSRFSPSPQLDYFRFPSLFGEGGRRPEEAGVGVRRYRLVESFTDLVGQQCFFIYIVLALILLVYLSNEILETYIFF